jgi:hypothetical protein
MAKLKGAVGAEAASGGTATLQAYALGMSGAGELTASSIQFAGALTGKIDDADKMASLATSAMSVTGPVVLVATGGNAEKAAFWSSVENLGLVGFKGGFTDASLMKKQLN